MVKNLRKRIAAVILTLAMVISLMPGVTLTAYAADPDYEINDSGFYWNDSNETIVLSGTNNRLTINEAPSAVIKIEVQSVDGSEVTINGNSVACDETYLVVSNKIKLTLDNLNITAPVSESALQLNPGGEEDRVTMSIAGSCFLT